MKSIGIVCEIFVIFAKTTQNMENENDPEFPSGRPRQRRKKLSEVQKHRMLKFMEQHPRLTAGGYDCSFTVDEGRRLWQELADILNALDGPKKSWEIWRRVRTLEGRDFFTV